MKARRIQAALIGLLVALALLGRSPSPWVTCGFLVFGVLNVLAEVPGTLIVRMFAVLIAMVTLAEGHISIAAMVLVWVIWLPAFVIGWGVGVASTRPPPEVSEEPRAGITQSRLAVGALVIAVAIGSIAYRVLVWGGLQQTAALFIGLPALISIVVVFGVAPRSATGVACKAVTIALLLSLVALQEGFLCVAMAAPLFYVIAIGVGGTIDMTRRKRGGDKFTTRFVSAVVVLTVPMSLEGVTPAMTISRKESVSVTRVVHSSAADIERALFEAPRFERTLPNYLRAGFPRVSSTRIERDAAGAMLWTMQVRGGEMLLSGMEHRIGTLVLALESQTPTELRWRVISDSSHTTHFLRWQRSVVQWEPLDNETSKVTWTLRYERGLDPAWYFGPMERYAVRLAAGYLIDSVATP